MYFAPPRHLVTRERRGLYTPRQFAGTLMPFHRGQLIQRGGGLWTSGVNLIMRALNYLIPVGKKAGTLTKKVLQTPAVQNMIGSVASDVASNLIKGKSVKEISKDKLESVKKAAKTAIQSKSVKKAVGTAAQDLTTAALSGQSVKNVAKKHLDKATDDLLSSLKRSGTISNAGPSPPKKKKKVFTPKYKTIL